MLKVEIVATIEMILNLWMRKALMHPSATPMAPATISPITQLPPPIQPRNVTARYCTTDAATAKEMSMPPAISTTSRPTAKMMLTELVLRRSNALPRVKKRSVAKERNTQMTAITARSDSSVA